MYQKEKKVISLRSTIFSKIFENTDAIFTGTYLHYGEVPKKTIVKRSIAENVKLRKQRLDIINKKKENINNELFNHYFRYLNQSIMLKRLRDASDERNKDLVESINEKLNKMKNIVKNVPKYRLEENKKIIDIVERILEFNSENRLGLGLKILTPNQMFSRLPITLAQFKAGNNSEKLKNEITQIFVFFVQITKTYKANL